MESPCSFSSRAPLNTSDSCVPIQGSTLSHTPHSPLHVPRNTSTRSLHHLLKIFRIDLLSIALLIHAAPLVLCPIQDHMQDSPTMEKAAGMMEMGKIACSNVLSFVVIEK